MPSPTHNRSLYINLADERIYRSAFNLTRPLLLQRMRYVEHMLAFLQHAELKTFPLMEQVLRVSCAQEGTFVDSGANEGSWSLVAASYGCKVIAVEPQPHCTQLLQTGVNANAGLGGRVRVVNAFLAATPMSVNFSADGSCRAARQVSGCPDARSATS
uniref:Methyltransferase FkbM domain-containing protein n=1 Tax=Emiliania huxleyi TaxID=2903 RepID=A0A7S3W140_EMIHU